MTTKANHQFLSNWLTRATSACEIVRDVDGPPSLRRSTLSRLQADRNAKIAIAYFDGVPIRKLAQQYAITSQQIYKILQRESATQGKTAMRQSRRKSQAAREAGQPVIGCTN